MWTRLLSLAVVAMPFTASADPGPVRGGGSVLVGTNTAFDGDPASLRLSIRGEYALAHDDFYTLSAVMPFTVATQGDSGFGISSQRTLFELPPSLRFRMFSTTPVRPYVDAGIGLVIATSEVTGWGFESSSSRTGWMTRTSVGVEIGPADGGLAFSLEPFGIQSYHVGNDSHASRWGAMIGAAMRF